MIGHFPPLRSARDVFRGPTLVVSPHPDDEVIGAGGTLAHLTRERIAVHVLQLTDGAGGDPQARFCDIGARRCREDRQALATLGIDTSRGLAFPDGSLELRVDDLVDALADEVGRFVPRHVIAPSPLEAHADHRAAAEAVRRLCAHGRHTAVDSVFFFGVNTPVPANVLIDITDVLATKERALAAYESQLAYVDLQSKVRAIDVSRTVNIELGEVVACEAFVWLEVSRVTEFFSVAEHLKRVLSTNGSGTA